jgi:hypothetical protein
MTTLTEVLPERKASRRGAINWTPAPGGAAGAPNPVAGVLTVHTDRASVAYAVAEFPTDWPGRGVRLRKLTAGTDPAAESYSVFCSSRTPAADRCDCRGFAYAGHCKHVDAVRALVANAWLGTADQAG